MTNNGRDIASSFSYEERSAREEKGTWAAGPTAAHAAPRRQCENSICVSYQLSSQSFLISRPTDLSPAPLAGTRDSQPLLSSSLNDKKMLFGELMVTDMAP